MKHEKEKTSWTFHKSAFSFSCNTESMSNEMDRPLKFWETGDGNTYWKKNCEMKSKGRLMQILGLWLDLQVSSIELDSKFSSIEKN